MKRKIRRRVDCVMGNNDKKEIKPGRYRHYKGNFYEVVGVANHSETLEKMVVYRALYGEGELWVRPISMWSELVDVEGGQVPRFEYCQE